MRRRGPRSAEDAESGRGRRRGDRPPTGPAVPGRPLCAALPTALQREKSLFDLWSAERRKPRRSGTPGPGPVLLETPSPPRCCWGLDTANRSAAAQTLATLTSPKPFPSAGLTPPHGTTTATPELPPLNPPWRET